MSGACRNCAAALPAAAMFCPGCGQKAATTRLTVHDLVHDFWHALTHTDKSVLALVRELAVRPGAVARRYVDGHRKAYFNPFTFLIVVVGVASIVLAASGFVSFAPRAGMPANAASRFFQQHINLVILFQVPMLAAFGMLLFRGARLHFAEHLVLAAYTSGFRSVFFTLAVAPLWMLMQWRQPVMLAGYITVWTLYFAFATMQFHQGGAVAFAKGVVVALLTQVVTTALIAVAITAAIALGWR